VEDDAFLATGVAIFNGARIDVRAEVRINGVVHLNTALPPDTTVPIGWVADRDPAEILPPGDHERIWAIQEPLDPLLADANEWARDLPPAQVLSQIGSPFADQPDQTQELDHAA
nr:hypothetical protein [Chloroflexota bacterium]